MTRQGAILMIILLVTSPLTAQLICRKPVVDLGRVAQARRIDVTFLLENKGTVPVRLRDVRVSCFCAKVKKRPVSLAPGGTGKLVITLDTGAFEGPVAKSILVTWDGSRQGALDLAFRLNVHPSWALEESVLHLGGGCPGEVLRGEVGVSADEGVHLSLGSHQGPFRSRLLMEKGGRRGVLKVEWTIPAKSKLGRKEALVEVRSDDPRKPNQFARIIAVVEGDLQVRPRRLDLGLRKSNVGLTRWVVLSSRAGRPFKIRRILENAFLVVEGDGGEALPVHRLRVTLPPGLPEGPKRGDLWVETDHPEGARIRIPYTFRIMKP